MHVWMLWILRTTRRYKTEPGTPSQGPQECGPHTVSCHFLSWLRVLQPSLCLDHLLTWKLLEKLDTVYTSLNRCQKAHKCIWERDKETQRDSERQSDIINIAAEMDLRSLCRDTGRERDTREEEVGPPLALGSQAQSPWLSHYSALPRVGTGGQCQPTHNQIFPAFFPAWQPQVKRSPPAWQKDATLMMRPPCFQVRWPYTRDWPRSVTVIACSLGVITPLLICKVAQLVWSII